MFNKSFVRQAVNNSAENATDRRRFLKAAGAAGLLGAGAATYAGAGTAFAGGGGGGGGATQGPSDAAILNFALNLEYLEAEFYLRALGTSLAEQGLTGESAGPVNVSAPDGGVSFSQPIGAYAREIAKDEKSHVAFLQSALGSAAVPQPALDLNEAFTVAARAAGVIPDDAQFNPYATEENFLLAAYIFEDVGVSAYKGAAPLIDNKAFLDAAAGILAVEAYHAGNIRTALYAKGIAPPEYPVPLIQATEQISAARDALADPSVDKDQGVSDGNIVLSDNNGIAFGRPASDVLNIVYLTQGRADEGGFFPQGVNGPINTSSAPASENSSGNAAGNSGNSGNSGEAPPPSAESENAPPAVNSPGNSPGNSFERQFEEDEGPLGGLLGGVLRR